MVDNTDIMREFLKNEDAYITIKLRGDLVKKFGKVEGFKIIEELMNTYKTDIRSINQELRKKLKEGEK